MYVVQAIHTQIEQSFHFVNFSYIALDVCIILVVVAADVAVPTINTCSISDCRVTFIFWFSQLKQKCKILALSNLTLVTAASHIPLVMMLWFWEDFALVTHVLLINIDSQPLCDECKCSLTVKHILLECCRLKDVRENYFLCSSLKELFENADTTTIIDFIKEVNFYHLV